MNSGNQIVAPGNQEGIIGTNKKVLLPIEYEDIKHAYAENTYVAKENG